MNQASVRRLGLAVLCGAAGAVVNALPLGAAVPLLLGRVLSLPVAMLCGPWPGALAAAITAVSLPPDNKAALFLILPLEAVLVGVFARRGKSPLVAGALLWGTVALSLVAVPSLFGVGHLRQTIWPIAMQTMLRGLVAVVGGDLLARGAAVQRCSSEAAGRTATPEHLRLSQRSFASPRCRSCCSPVDSHVSACQARSRGRGKAVGSGDGAQSPNRGVRHQPTPMRCNPGRAMSDSKLSSSDRQRLIDPIRRSIRASCRCSPPTVTGVQEIFPPRDSRCRHRPIASFSSTRCGTSPTVSDVILGADLAPAESSRSAVPIVLSDGGPRRDRRLARSVEIRALHRRFRDACRCPDHGARSTRSRDLHEQGRRFFDGRTWRRTIWSGKAARRRMASTLRAVIAGADGSPRSARIAAAALMPSLGWKVFIEQPLLTLRLQSTGYYALTLGLMLLALGAAVLGARAFAGAVTRPLEEVITVVRSISAHGGKAEARLSSNPPAEIAELLGPSRHADSPGGFVQRSRRVDPARAPNVVSGTTEDLDRKFGSAPRTCGRDAHRRGRQPRQ